ncbi:14760_t:CDS:2, partial [Racocetra fulgida]
MILPTESNETVIGSDISLGNVICKNGLLQQEAMLSVWESTYESQEAEAFDKASPKIKLVAIKVAQFIDSNISTANDFFDLYIEELKCPNEFLPIPAKWYSALIMVVTLTVCHRVRLRGLIESLKKRNGASFKGFFHLSQPNIIAENIITSDEINKIFDQEYERVMFSQSTVEVGQYFLTLDIILEEKVAWAYYGSEKEIKDEVPRNQIYEEFGEQKGRFTLGNWTELMFKEQEDSLFQQSVLKAIAKMETMGDVLHLSREKFDAIKFHWNRISITKEYLKVINLKRVVIKKAISGVEK